MWRIEFGRLTVARLFGRSTRGAHFLLDGVGGSAAGQSTVEYALVGALVVIAAAGALTLLGGELSTVFTHISDTLRTASAGH
jgi:Flp pilus assembly pilin Flp